MSKDRTDVRMEYMQGYMYMKEALNKVEDNFNNAMSYNDLGMSEYFEKIAKTVKKYPSCAEIAIDYVSEGVRFNESVKDGKIFDYNDSDTELAFNVLDEIVAKHPDIADKASNIKEIYKLEHNLGTTKTGIIGNSTFMYVNPAMKNPKTGENVREAESAKLAALKKAGKVIVGLEMTVPALAELCDKNIDPQHTDGNSAQSCVKEVTENAEKYLKEYKDKDVVFVTNRVDADSVAAYVSADRYLQGEPQDYNENVAAINKHDTFSAGKWQGPKPIEKAFDPENKIGALASSIKVFSVTQDNIKAVADFIDTGKVDETTMANYQKVQNGIIDRVNSGEIKVEVKGGIANVTTTLPCATNVGYSKAPVVIAINPAAKGPDGKTYRKISICQHDEGYVDMSAIKTALNKEEPGWGGSSTFIGSKQGEDCNIPLEKLLKIVSENLTPEYKAKLVAQTKMMASKKDYTK